MKTITPEIKARVFAQYWNQLVWKANEYGLLLNVNAYNFDLAEKNGINLNYSYLELKNIKDITENDAFEVANLFNYKPFSIGYNNIQIREPIKFIHKEYKVLVEYSDGCKIVIFSDGSGIDLIKKDSDCMAKVLDQTDYLKFYHLMQSKGYALPYMDYLVEDLIKLSVYKLKK